MKRAGRLLPLPRAKSAQRRKYGEHERIPTVTCRTAKLEMPFSKQGPNLNDLIQARTRGGNIRLAQDVC